MAARHVFLLALGFAFASSAVVPGPARAQDEDQSVPEVQNAKHQFIGRVTGTAFVRSGPSNNFYATAKLEKNTEVTVVGLKYEWLKIVPPEGSFSLVPQVYVTRRGDGKIGRVNNALNVRAGSSENAMKSTIQTKLAEGQDVTIIGEQDEYYKIVPPDGAYVFINKQYVEPVGPVGKVAAGRGGDAGQEARGANVRTGDEPADDASADASDAEGPAGEPEVEQAEAEVDPAPDTRPTRATASAGDAAPAKPAATASTEDFRKLEAEFEAASKMPVVDQPIEQLTERYTRLVRSGGLRGSMKQIAQARLVALQMRTDAREQLREFRKSQEQLRMRQQELAVERQEIDERIARTQVSLYAAVGTLRVSSLQQGGTMLYRLTDPATGRTMVYIRSNDPKYAVLLDKFVGVRGDLTNDQRLGMKIVTPADAEVVDPSKVNSTVIATVVPPSMVATAAVDQADAGN
jgi:hypothetical protein